MRRAITLIVVLTVMCLGLGLWLDLTQRHTAREYLDALDVVRREVQTTSPNALVSDIMPLAAEAVYPIAVVDGDGQLKGIVTKASVLASLI